MRPPPEESALFKLIIGNRAYSSWSFRGWLACKQSGEEFEELVVPMFDADWEQRREGDEFAPSLGKVPILWDGEIVVWDSLAIIEFLADRHGPALYWPEDEGARAVARSMSAEMHSGFSNLRRELPMNVRKSFPPVELSQPVREEVDRILQMWAQARARFGGTGDFLFGDWCAADIMYAPVVTRFITYGVPMPNFAGIYMKAVLSQPHVAEWIDKAQDEPWVIEQYEVDKAA
jgi:glutathione S-transferase